MTLTLDHSAGYAGSWLVGRNGFLDAREAKREGWVTPKDKQAAEKIKQDLHRKMEEKKKMEEAEKKKKEQKKKSSKVPAGG